MQRLYNQSRLYNPGIPQSLPCLHANPSISLILCLKKIPEMPILDNCEKKPFLLI